MKKTNTKYIVAIIISLIIGLSIFGYGYLDYKYKKEALEQKVTSEEKAKTDQEKAKLQNEIDLENCLEEAENNYHDNWFRECKSQGLLSNKCIHLSEITFEEYAKENSVPSSSENLEERLAAIKKFYDERGECSCRLSFANADRIEEWKKDDKEECYQKYSQ